MAMALPAKPIRLSCCKKCFRSIVLCLLRSTTTVCRHNRCFPSCAKLLSKKVLLWLWAVVWAVILRYVARVFIVAKYGVLILYAT